MSLILVIWLRKRCRFCDSYASPLVERMSEDLSNALGIPDLNNLDVVDDEEEAFDGSELDATADETPATGGDDFMHTDDFRRLFVGFVTVDTLVAMRWLDKNGTR